jgi:Trk K+ transport system NAD-binding subunit
LILSVRRDDTITVPHSDMVLRRGDLVGLIGSPEAVEEAIALLRR